MLDAKADVLQMEQIHATPRATQDIGLTLQPISVKVSASLLIPLSHEICI